MKTYPFFAGGQFGILPDCASQSICVQYSAHCMDGEREITFIKVTKLLNREYVKRPNDHKYMELTTNTMPPTHTYM